MKALAIIFGILVACQLSSQTISPQRRTFDFNSWRNIVVNQYDNFLKEKDADNLTPSWLREDIEYINEAEFMQMLDSVSLMNNIKNWDEMYYVFHFSQGEVNLFISSFIFFKGKKCWGISFLHNNGKYYTILEKKASKIRRVKSLMRWSGGIAIVSRFDNKMTNLKNTFLVGFPYGKEFEPIMDWYNKEIFD